MKVARFRVSPELFLRSLSLPSDVTFVGASVDPITGGLEFTVTHDALSEQPEGAVGACSPVLRRDENGAVEFMGWGQ